MEEKMILEFNKSESKDVQKQRQKAQKIFKKYAKVIWDIQENGVEWDCFAKKEVVSYFVALKRPYGVDEGTANYDYWADHFVSSVEDLEDNFKLVEKIDPETWDNNGEPVKK